MKEENTRLLNLIGMNEAGITTEEKSIIGTQALATCFGILLYERKKKDSFSCPCIHQFFAYSYEFVSID